MEPIKHVVLNSGGLIVYAYAGFFNSNQHLLKEVETVTGASAGAIWAMLYAFGYDPREIMEILLTIKINELSKASAVSFIKTFGVYSQELIRSTLLSMVDDRDLTFAELDITLFVAAYCLNTNKTEYFSKDTTPSVKVVDAVLASMSIPGLFSPVRIGKKYYLDGAFVDKWPSDPVIGFNPKHVLRVEPADKNWSREQGWGEIKTFKDYFKMLFWSLNAHRHNYQMNTHRVSITLGDGLDAFDFASGYEALLKMVASGASTGYFLGD
jgi:predicted acylesterase/phospholipase RssA